MYLTDICNQISERINQFTYQMLDYLDQIELPTDPKDPLIQTYLDYCPPLLREKFQEQLLTHVPDHHKKAIISCQLSAQLVYKRGLQWMPSLVDILPLILRENK